MIRTEFLFHGKEESVNTYLSKMALVFDSICNRVEAKDGKKYYELLSETEIEELKSYVWGVMDATVEESVRFICNHNNMKNLMDDYRQKFSENIWRNFYKYNNPRFKAQKTNYAFETFINNYCADAVRITLRQYKGISKSIETNARKIKRTKDYLIDKIGMKASEITVDDIFMFMPDVTVSPISKSEILHVMEASQACYSIDSMENGEEQIEQVIMENNIDPEFVKTIVEFVEGMRPMQQFVFLQNYGFCGYKYLQSGVKQMACDDCFLRLCKEDKIGSKHIKHGTLKIERPRIEVGEKQRVLIIEDIDYVEEKFILNERDRARNNLMKLVKACDYEPEDFEGIITNVLLNQWVKLMDEIEKCI